MNWRKIPQTPENLAKICKGVMTEDEERKGFQKQADEKEASVKEGKEVIRLIMNKCLMSEVKTPLGTVRLVPKTIYQADIPNDGWDKIWAYIVKTKAYDLLEKRLHQGACKARYEDKQKIPGVKLFEMVVIKLGDAE